MMVGILFPWFSFFTNGYTIGNSSAKNPLKDTLNKDAKMTKYQKANSFSIANADDADDDDDDDDMTFLKMVRCDC